MRRVTLRLRWVTRGSVGVPLVNVKKEEKKEAPCALGTRFLANAGTPFQGWEKEREREGLSTPLDEVKINSCSQRRNSIYRERRSRVVFLLSSFSFILLLLYLFIFFHMSIRPFSILGLFSLLVFDASFVVDTEDTGDSGFFRHDASTFQFFPI